MSFTSGGTSGPSSIAAGSDVQLSALADREVLTYDSGAGRWRNLPAAGVPSGGSFQQVLAKKTNASWDVEWAGAPRLANTLPLPDGSGGAGAATTVARADHVHPVPSGIGYPLPQQGSYLNPLGASVNDTINIAVGAIRVSPLPVFKPYRLSVIIPGLRGNEGERNMQIALFASHPDDWTPTTRVGGVISATSDVWMFPVEPKFTNSILVRPGLYWVAVLAMAPSAVSTTVLQAKAFANTFHIRPSYTGGLSTYYYPDGAFSSMPVSLVGASRVTENATPFSYYIQASRF